MFAIDPPLTNRPAAFGSKPIICLIQSIVSRSISTAAGAERHAVRFAFKASPNDFDTMPDANYASLRVGVKASYAADGFEPYLAGEGRVVQSGGVNEQRFASTNVDGLRAALGFAVRFGAIAGRVEGSIMRYAWTLDNSEDPSSKWKATGASDFLLGGSLFIGYTF